MTSALTARGLRKRYGDTWALDGLTSNRDGAGARAARPQRCREHHGGADLRDADPSHGGRGHDRRTRPAPSPERGTRGDRSGRRRPGPATSNAAPRRGRPSRRPNSDHRRRPVARGGQCPPAQEPLERRHARPHLPCAADLAVARHALAAAGIDDVAVEMRQPSLDEASQCRSAAPAPTCSSPRSSSPSSWSAVSSLDGEPTAHSAPPFSPRFCSNPVSTTAAACRDPFGNPTGTTEGLLADHALVHALAWPVALLALFVPLTARAYCHLGD